jgi:hypothetical protein
MLGYVTPWKGELKLREFEVYNAYYCAVCHAMRDRYGQIPRLLLSYDSVFLAMLLESLSPEDEVITEFRCATHPGKRRNITEATSKIDYAADIMLLLGYCKLIDDKEDEHRLRGIAGVTVLKRHYRKVSRRLPEKEKIIREKLKDLSLLEKQKNADIDLAADPFADIMEEVFDWPRLEEEENAENLRFAIRQIGRNIGKWIYLIDAVDDREKDRKSGAYNPLLLREYSKESLRLNLLLYLAAIGEAIDVLPIRKNRVIIENIVYIGMNKRTEDVLAEYLEEKNAGSL